MAEEFDFVIVAVGSAGSAIAARLSERMDFRVLALEAGRRPRDPALTQKIDIPWRWAEVQHTATRLAIPERATVIAEQSDDRGAAREKCRAARAFLYIIIGGDGSIPVSLGFPRGQSEIVLDLRAFRPSACN